MVQVEKSSTLILINPKARNGSLSSHWSEREKQVLEALGEKSAQVVFTSESDYGSLAVRNALLSGVKRIVVVGGDGTLSEAVQGFFHDDGTPIAPDSVLMVMPGGRGDDFFKAMTNQRFYSSEAAWNRGLELLARGKPTPVDIGQMQWIGSGTSAKRHFINIASFGFPGLVVQGVQHPQGILSSSMIRKTSWVYGLHGLAAMSQYQPLSVEVKVDDQDFFSGKIHSGFVLNGRYNAGGICWDSDARIDDGLFHVFVMEDARSRMTTVKNTARIILGSRQGLQGVHRTHGKKVEVVLKKDQMKPHPLFEIDGDIVEEGSTRGAVFETIAGGLRVVMGLN